MPKFQAQSVSRLRAFAEKIFVRCNQVEGGCQDVPVEFVAVVSAQSQPLASLGPCLPRCQPRPKTGEDVTF